MWLLKFFRRRSAAELSEWHECDAPLFKTAKLKDGSTAQISDILMRRKINGWWEYRALTDEEFKDHQDRWQW
jgi:hypothetical protein